MQNHNIHIIQPNDSLKSLSLLYRISEDSLKFFHNNHCKAKDTILIDITHQKEIYLPRDIVEDADSLVHFSSGNSLTFSPQNWEQKFGVIINIEDGNEKNELKYEASIKWLKTENHLHYFEIDRISKPYINEEVANDIADLLAYKTSQVLYPLYVSVDLSGKYNAVENLNIYKKRWNNIKKEVDKEFEGETVEEYCRKIEEILDEPEMLNLLLRNDYFLRTIFFGIYKKFGDKYLIIGEESFPIVDNLLEPNYKIELEIDPLKDDYDLVNIEGYGVLYEERSIQDFINNTPFSFLIEENPLINNEGDFRLQFYMNSKTLLPESLYLECDILLEIKKKVSVVIATIQ